MNDLPEFYGIIDEIIGEIANRRAESVEDLKARLLVKIRNAGTRRRPRSA